MELVKKKSDGKHYLRLELRGEVLHEQECHYDRVEFFETMYRTLYKIWTEEQSKAVLNRWATYQWLCTEMGFPMETGAHAAIFVMVNSDAHTN